MKITILKKIYVARARAAVANTGSGYPMYPQNRWGAPIDPSTALGDPGFAFRVILPAFLERFSASNAFPTAFLEEKNWDNIM